MKLKEFLKKTPLLKIVISFNQLKSKYENKYVIPTYREKRGVIKSYIARYNTKILIETGTFLGDTLDVFKNDFQKLYSFELSKELATKAAERFSKYEHIEIINADSGIELVFLLDNICEPCLFWLDGHYSSEFFIGEVFIKTAKGNKETPIVEELTAILNDKKNKHVILIDDARLFIGKNDYPSIGKVKSLVKKINDSYSVLVKNDMIHILPK